jgi:excinuclease UvrABC nuclease subunit
MSILDRAMAMQREQEAFTSDKAKINAEQSRAKGANKKKLFMDHSADDDEFEVAGNAYTMTEEKLKNIKKEDMFSSKSHSFEAVKASKEDLERYGIKKGMTADDIALMRSKFE